MTLIVAALTKKKGFLFGDKTRTISSKDGSPVQLQMPNVTIKAEGTVYLQSSMPKIHQLFGNTAYIAMAGDEKKFQTFLESLNVVQQLEDFNSYVNQYWLDHQNDSPDQMLILSKKPNVIIVESYCKCNNELYDGYDHCTYIPKDDKILFLAMGSGAESFLGFSHAINEELNQQYMQSLRTNSFQEWEEKFKALIKSIYSDIHHYIRSVGDEIDVVEI